MAFADSRVDLVSAGYDAGIQFGELLRLTSQVTVAEAGTGGRRVNGPPRDGGIDESGSSEHSRLLRTADASAAYPARDNGLVRLC